MTLGEAGVEAAAGLDAGKTVVVVVAAGTAAGKAEVVQTTAVAGEAAGESRTLECRSGRRRSQCRAGWGGAG